MVKNGRRFVRDEGTQDFKEVGIKKSIFKVLCLRYQLDIQAEIQEGS